MQWIIDNLLHVSLFLFYLWEMPPTLALAAYSHGSVAKQWPRNCEALKIQNRARFAKGTTSFLGHWIKINFVFALTSQPAMRLHARYLLSAMCVQCSIRNGSYCPCSLGCAVCFALAIHRTIALIRLSPKQPGTMGISPVARMQDFGSKRTYFHFRFQKHTSIHTSTNKIMQNIYCAELDFF